MKKLTKLAAVLMIICLCFTSAAFAAGETGSETDASTGETIAEENGDAAAETAEEETITEGTAAEETAAEEGETSEEEAAEEPGEATGEEVPGEDILPEETKEGTSEEAAEPLIIELPAAEPVQGDSGEGSSVYEIVPGETHMEGPVWGEAENPGSYPDNMAEKWIRVNDNLGVDGDIVTLKDIPWKNGSYSRSGAAAGSDMEKLPQMNTPSEIPLVVLVIGFNNIDYNANYNWGSAIFTASDSLARYYTDQSYGKFTFVPAKETSAYGTGGNTNKNDKQNDGVVHVKISDPHRDWSLDISSMNQSEMYITECQAIKDAILASDRYVNYKSFDANGDGKITTNEMALAVIMAGYEAAYDSSKTQGANKYLWSHAWSLSGGAYYYQQYYGGSFALPAPDGVVVNNFITIPENLEAGTQEPISVLAHELGHYLGLPDLYDTESKSQNAWYNYNAAALSVMCGGSWTNNGSKYIPASFDAWSKCALGWVRPTVVKEGQYTVQSNSGNYNVLMVRTTNPNEYYLIENRQYTGWDAGIANYGSYSSYASNGGLVFWHIDDAVFDQYDYGNTVNGSSHRPGVMPLFPETTNGTTSGTVTLIGKLPSDWVYRALWNSSICSNLTGQTTINLPMYNGSNTPSGRKNSGINCKFLSNSGTSMTVQFSGSLVCVDRIAGMNRYKTALTGADVLKGDIGTSTFSNVVIASGNDYADALAGSYLAVRYNAPILLVNSATVNTVATYVKSNMSSSGTVFILGGTAAVPASMVTALTNKGISSSRIERLAGANRYETNIRILEKVGVSGKDLLICSGKDYPDALSASALGRPIFLTNNAALLPAQKTFLNSYAKQISNFYVIGGTGVVSNKISWDVYNYYDPNFDRYHDDPSSAKIGRVSGANRYKTSAEVARIFFYYSQPQTVFLAYANDFPDGLSGGPIAWRESAPLILVTNSNKDDARSFVANTSHSKNCKVMGGTALISDKTAYYILGY